MNEATHDSVIRRNRPGAYSELVFACFVVLFVFQSALEKVHGAFGYIDELPAAVVLLVYGWRCVVSGSIRTRNENRFLALFLLLYVLSSFAGNLLYRYQGIGAVIIDFITNIKFYLTLAFASVVLRRDPRSFKRIPLLARALIVFLFLLFAADYVLDIFPHGFRYGIKYSQLFYGHPTYYSGCCAFLVGLLSYYGTKRNLGYIFLGLIMLFFSLRGKAIASVMVFLILFLVVFVIHSRLKFWQIALIALASVAIAWEQIRFYFIELSGLSARSVMMSTSFKVMKDYFPLGTGFATYGSHQAAEHYSPVYVKYGFRNFDELKGTGVTSFLDDQFWPIVFGQSGVIGTLFYLAVLVLLFSAIQKLRKYDKDAYLSSLFLFLYLLISSTAEPAFNNAIAIPMAAVIGMAITTVRYERRDEDRKEILTAELFPPGGVKT